MFLKENRVRNLIDDNFLMPFFDIIRKNVASIPLKKNEQKNQFEIDDPPFPFNHLHELASKEKNFLKIKSLIKYFPSDFNEIKKEFKKVNEKINMRIISLDDFFEKTKNAIEAGMLEREKLLIKKKKRREKS